MFTPSLCSFPVESTHASFPSRPNNRFSFDHRNRVDCSRFDQFALLSIRTSPGVITIIGIVFSNPSDQSGRRDLNPQHLAWKASALPLSYSRIDTPPHRLILTSILQRLAGSLGCITWYLLHPEFCDYLPSNRLRTIAIHGAESTSITELFGTRTSRFRSWSL